VWHGNSAMALAHLEDIEDDLASWGDDDAQQPRSERDAAARMGKYVRELAGYITQNAGSIVNYGERYRNDERISVVSKRLVK
jgi:hypothetical protein